MLSYLFIEFYDYAIDFIEPRHSMTEDGIILF